MQINIIEESGWTAIERNNGAYKMLNQNELKAQRQECVRKYKTLLGIAETDWDH